MANNRSQYHKNVFGKGMNKDLGPTSVPSDMYIDALNAAELNDSGDFLERTNEKGTLELPGKIVSTTNPEEQFRVLGHCVLNGEIILLSVNTTNTLSEIGVMDTDGSYVSLLTTEELNFNIEHEIEVVGRIYFNGDRVIYWTDDFNTPRILNLDDIPETNVGDSTDLFITQSLPVAEFSQILEKQGSITAGTYQFIPRYLDETLNPTFFGIITNPIPVNVEFRGEGRNQFDGDIQGATTSKSIEVNVTNVDNDFEFLELIVIVRDGPVGVPRAFVMQRKQIDNDEVTFVFSGLQGDEKEIQVEDVIVERPSYATAKCIEQIDSRLLLSNLTTASEDELQELTNQISMRYQVRELEYQDTVNPTGNEDVEGSPDELQLLEVFVNLERDENNTPINTNQIVFRFNRDVNPLTAANSFALVTTKVTGGAFVHARIAPASIEVQGRIVIATFGPSEDFTDDTTWNFDDYNLVDDSVTGHVPITTWGVGSDLDGITGTGTADITDALGGFSFTGIGSIYVNQNTCSIADASGEITVTLANAPTDLTFDTAIYGTNHTTNNQGLFSTVESTSSSVFTIDSTAAGNEAAGTPVIVNPTVDIAFKNLTVLQNTGSFANEGYFGDYKDEKLATDFKTYTRDETYSLCITYLFKNGGQSSPFHIVGRNRTSADAAIKDIPSWVPQSYSPGNAVTWLGNVYTSSSATTSAENPSNAPNKWLYNSDILQQGWCGTYESEEKYTPESGLPSGTVSPSSPDYSAGGFVRHIKMPTNEEEPLYKYTPDNRIFIRVIGLAPVWEDNGVIKSINDLINTSSVGGNVVGFIIGREARDSAEKRSVVMQGVGQNLWEHKGGGFDADLEIKKPYISNSYFFGRTLLNPLTTRVYPRHDRLNGNIGFGYEEQRKDLVQFYSPDIDLLDREVPSGASLKPVLNILGDISIAAQKQPKTYSDNPEGGLSHLFCTYNEIGYLGGVGSVPVPFITDVQRPGYSDETFDYAFSNIPNVDVPVSNYYNEGYTLLNLGPGGVMPEPNPGGFDVRYQLFAIKSEGGIRSTGTFFLNKSERSLYNLVLNNSRQYGSIGSGVYVNAGVFANRNSIIDPEDALFFGGDTFISKYSYKNSGTWRWIVDKQGNPSSNPSSNKHRPVLNAREQGVNGGEGEEFRAVGYFFVESEVNCNWRHRESKLQPDGTIKEINSDFYPHRKLTGVEYLGPFNAIRFPQTEEEFGVLDYAPSLGNSRGYNKSYSAQDTIGNKVGRPFGFEEVTDYPNRTIYSDLSIEGEASDKFRKFKANNYHDIPKDKGEIVNTFTQGNVLYHQTRDAIWRSFVNERTAVPTSSGDIILGNGGLFPLPSKTLLTLEGGQAGIQHQFGFAQTPYGSMWVDAARGKLFRLSGEASVEEMTIKGMMVWFDENIKQSPGPLPLNFKGLWEVVGTYQDGDVVKYNSRFYDVIGNPPVGTVPTSFEGKEFYELRPQSTFQDNPSNPQAQGIRLGYDKKLRRLLITKRDFENPFTLSFSMLTQAFISRHSYQPTRYIGLENRLIGVDNQHFDGNGLRVWEHNEGDYGKYYNEDVAPMELVVSLNPDYEVSKVFDNLIFLTESYSPEFVEQLRDTFDTLQAYQQNSNTGEIVLDPDLPSLNFDISKTKVSRTNDEFRVSIPPDAVLDKNQSIFDSSNLTLSLPIGDPKRLYRPRMKGKYLVTKLKYLNLNNNKFIVNGILSKRGNNAL